MRNGGSAADAVEIAIKIMEDREITNAAYGSNLAMDGVVECDAVIVDQYGRSGGCGAVARQYATPLIIKCMLTVDRDQKPNLSGETGTGRFDSTTQLASCTTKFACRPRGCRLCCQFWHACLAP